MHTSFQGLQEKKINVLKKELTKIDWYTGMDSEFELEWQKKTKNLHGCFEIEENVLGVGRVS